MPCIGNYPLNTILDNCPNQFAREGLDIYTKFIFFYIKGNKRSTDPILLKLLHNLRRKQIDDYDLNIIKSRLFKNVKNRHLFNDSPAVFNYKTDVRRFSNYRIKKLGLPILKLDIKISPERNSIKGLNEIEPILLCVGTKLYLTQNISLQSGIYSGCPVTFVSPFYSSSNENINFPSCIFVKIPSANCKKLPGDIIPIFPSTESYEINGKRVKVTSYNLKSDFAYTYYGIQGRKFDKLMLKLDNREVFPNSTYMAFGRVEKLDDIILLDENISKSRFSDNSFLKMSDECKLEAERFGILDQIYSPLNV